MARAARLHYEFDLTHQEVATTLGLSRVKVTRLLKKARQTGLVQITVLTELSLFMTMEEHEAALHGAGFTNVHVLLQAGGLVLYRGDRPAVAR